MRVVVTGGLGHIGSRLIRKIPEEIPGCEITIVDNMMCQRFCSLFNLPQGVKYNFIDGDILQPEMACIIKGADVVVNLAANTEPEKSVGREAEVENINFIGTKNLAEYCKKYDVPFIFPSSTSVYTSAESIVDENTFIDIRSAQSPYAKSKILSEEYLISQNKEGLRYTVFRFGTIFGISPGMRFHTAVNKFSYQACKGIPLTVWETAYNQRRPYLDIEDAVSVICHIIKNKIYKNEIYNVVTVNATVKDIIDEISKTISDVEIKYIKSEIMNNLSYDVSCEKIKDTGFEIKGSLSRGVKDTLKLFEGIWKYR